MTFSNYSKALVFTVLGTLPFTAWGSPRSEMEADMNRPLEVADFSSEESMRSLEENFPFKIFKKPGLPGSSYLIVYSDPTHQMPITNPFDRVSSTGRWQTLLFQGFLTAVGLGSAYSARQQIKDLKNPEQPDLDLAVTQLKIDALQNKIYLSLASAAALVTHGVLDVSLRKKYGHKIIYQIPFFLGGNQQTKKESRWIAAQLNRIVENSVKPAHSSLTTPTSSNEAGNEAGALIFPVLPLHFKPLAHYLRLEGFYAVSREEFITRTEM